MFELLKVKGTAVRRAESRPPPLKSRLRISHYTKIIPRTPVTMSALARSKFGGKIRGAEK